MTFHPEMPYGTGLHRSERRMADEGPPFEFTPDNRSKLETIAARYPAERRRSAILPALYLVQRQQGHVTSNAMRHVAEVVGCTPAEVEDVVSYYSMFYTQPAGTYVLHVCRTLSCALTGSERVVDALSEKLGIEVGETDPTGTFTLHEIECLGACDRGPVLMVNDQWHERVTPEGARRLVDDLRARGESALSGCHLRVERDDGTDSDDPRS